MCLYTQRDQLELHEVLLPFFNKEKSSGLCNRSHPNFYIILSLETGLLSFSTKPCVFEVLDLTQLIVLVVDSILTSSFVYLYDSKILQKDVLK
jgi:hypothetical protein